jgi:hypothetical protein
MPRMALGQGLISGYHGTNVVITAKYVHFPAPPPNTLRPLGHIAVLYIIYCELSSKVLMVLWRTATLCLLYTVPTMVHTFMDTLHSMSFTLVFLIALRSEEGLHSGAEPRIELGAALQQPNTLPSELCRTLTELRRTLLS